VARVCLANLKDKRSQWRRSQPARDLLLQHTTSNRDGSIILPISAAPLSSDDEEKTQASGMGTYNEIHERGMGLRQGHPM
jgi:hypothetical protein